MSFPEQPNGIDALIDAHLDQTIDAAGIEQLDRLVTENPKVSARMIHRCRLSYQIVQILSKEQAKDAIGPIDFEALQGIEPETVELRRVEYQDRPTDKPKRKTPRIAPQQNVPSKGYGFSLAGLNVHVGKSEHGGVSLRRLLSLAAVLAFAAAVIFMVLNDSPPPGPDDLHYVESPPSIEPEVAGPALSAQIVNSFQPMWESQAPSDPARLIAGSAFSLRSGFVELEFARGARVLIEGPCRFELIDDNSMRLEEGRLVANVPAQAKLFAVSTPYAKVVDFGTEFCVDVLADGDTEVAVFEGLVELGETSRDSAQVTHQIALTTGQASRVDSEHGLDTNVKAFHPGSQRIYVRRIEDADSIDIAYARMVQELKPIAYWPMMGKSPLKSESLGADSSFEFTAVGEAEVQREAGPVPFGENQAIAINGGQAFYAAGPFDSDLWEENAYSICLWVRIDERSDQNIITFVPSLQQRGSHYSNQIRMAATGKVQHYSFCPKSLNPELDNYSTVRVESNRPVTAERWAHVVATYGEGRSRLYIDGKLVGQEKARHKFENSYPTLLIGGATGFRRQDKAGDLKGAACQLALFNRVLTLKEIKALSDPEQSLNP